MKDPLQTAVEMALASGKIQRESLKEGFAIHHKGEINLVTDADIACQEMIISMIRESFPEDDIIAEEKANRFEGNKNRWIVDPIDGTTNYAHGYPFFCTSIAYEVKGSVVAGVVYNPMMDELFFAARGKGAYLNGNRIKVSSVQNLKASLLSTGFPYDITTNPDNNINHFIQFLYEAQAVRRDGSAALNLSYVACGRFDGFWEIYLNPWDLAAGALIVEEAGGAISSLDGGAFSIYGGGVIASNGLIHETMTGIIGKGLPSAEDRTIS
ncbi:MAG: inositol monophosphatase family protein [Syntrophorhabdaceae bacterium]|nr:inositol monophosphatase family protein [Syntrophorhabdaceae bacterium]